MDIVLPEDPSIPLLGIYSKDASMYNKAHVHSSLIYNGQKLEKTHLTFDCEWVQIMLYIYTMEYYSAIKIMSSWNSWANRYN